MPRRNKPRHHKQVSRRMKKRLAHWASYIEFNKENHYPMATKTKTKDTTKEL